VVFVPGCPWRCTYCHNPGLQSRAAVAAGLPGWAGVLRWLQRRVGLLDAVVFSGGEPTADPGLGAAIAAVRALGFGVGLHTAGIYPRRLAAVLPAVDWVGLDIKAPLVDAARHEAITGVRGSLQPVRRSLALLLDRARAFECRTTAHPRLLDDAALLTLAEDLSSRRVANWALQICSPRGCSAPLPAVGEAYPQASTLARLQACFPGFVLRRA
jgi:anaerobic ribonucleoside-triphosphate reductase activating protein